MSLTPKEKGNAAVNISAGLVVIVWFTALHHGDMFAFISDFFVGFLMFIIGCIAGRDLCGTSRNLVGAPNTPE